MSKLNSPKWLLLIILASLFSLKTFAVVPIVTTAPSCSLATPIVFEQANELNTPLKALAAAAIVRVGKSRCSGAFVSDKHVLLAAHCLDGCFPSKSSNKTSNNTSSWQKNHRDVFCDVSVNGNTERAKIEVMTQCSASRRLRAAKALTRGRKISAEDTACAGEPDLAILKLNDASPDLTRKHGCLGWKDRPIDIGAKLYTLGVPERTERGVGDADGTHLQLSKGERIDSNFCTSTKLDRESGQPTTVKLSKSKAITGLSGMIQTTVDVNKGSSGGPMIDEDSQIVAVASIKSKSNNAKYECRGATFAQPLNALTLAARRWGAGFDTGLLKCPAGTPGRTDSPAAPLDQPSSGPQN